MMGRLPPTVAAALAALTALVAVTAPCAHATVLTTHRAAVLAPEQSDLQLEVKEDGDLQLSNIEVARKLLATEDAVSVLEQSVEKGERPFAAELSMFLKADQKSKKLELVMADGSKKETGEKLARAKWGDTIEKSGWARLDVETGAEKDNASAELQMYAAGFLEGFLSTKRIQEFRHNANALSAKDEEKHHALGHIRRSFANKIRNIVQNSVKGEKATATTLSLTKASRPKAAPWWTQARYMLVQAIGIRDGFNRRRAKSERYLSLVDLVVLSSDGETPELMMAYDNEEVLLRQSEHDPMAQGEMSDDDDIDKNSFLQRAVSVNRLSKQRELQTRRKQKLERRQLEKKSMTNEKFRDILHKSGRCSALVKLTDDDAFFGHTTFSDFSEMTRVFKYYTFPLPDGAAASRIGFSSYPGIAGSTDDYYLTDAGLAVTETTISMMNDELYDKLDDANAQLIPDYMRIMLATRMAKSGKEWVDYMVESSTDLYSSQWMVLDTHKFKKGVKNVEDGLLFVLDQIPTKNHVEDMTQSLRDTGYWGSYNRAWFEDVRDKMGMSEMELENGVLFSRDHSPRANIFRKTAAGVTDLESMKKEMQRNHWPDDVDGGPQNTPDHAIAARSDLDRARPDANGAVDSKVANLSLIKQQRCEAISGPTTGDGKFKPFRWVDEKGKELWPSYPHEGMPNVWNFGWTEMGEGLGF